MDSHACSVTAMGSHVWGSREARMPPAQLRRLPCARRDTRRAPVGQTIMNRTGTSPELDSPSLVAPSGSGHVGHEAKTGTITFAARLKRIHVWVPQGQINACLGAARPLEASVCAARPEYTGLVCHGATSAFRFRGTQGQNDWIRWHAWPERRHQVARMARYGESVGTIPDLVDHGR